MKTKKISKSMKNNMITYGIAIVAFIVVQIMLATGSMSSLMKGLLVPLCTYAILAVSLNLTVGILGELSLGHAGFMCVGAFASAFFSVCTAQSIHNDLLRFMIALLIGAVTAGLFGILIGIPVLRLQGDYLAIVTLAFGEIIKNVINALYVGIDGHGLHVSLKDSASLNLEADGRVIINGAQGISGTPNDSTFDYLRYCHCGLYCCSDHAGHRQYVQSDEGAFSPPLYVCDSGSLFKSDGRYSG